MPTKDFAYVVQNDQLLFCSEENQNDIKCFTPSGDVLWRFRHNSMLSPHQISVDRDGFIYVSCYKSNNIFVISSDGQNGKEILDSANGLVNPTTLSKNNIFMLSYKDGPHRNTHCKQVSDYGP
jgi:sugar lactone lactonase YvrE